MEASRELIQVFNLWYDESENKRAALSSCSYPELEPHRGYAKRAELSYFRSG